MGGALVAFDGWAADSYLLNVGGVDYSILDVYASYVGAQGGVLLNVFLSNVSWTGGPLIHNDLVGGTWFPQWALSGGSIDTFVTIGDQIGPSSSTGLDPAFGGGGNPQFIPSGAGWFNGSPPNLQGKAQAGAAGLEWGTLVGRFVIQAGTKSSGPFTLSFSACQTSNAGLGTPGVQSCDAAVFEFASLPDDRCVADLNRDGVRDGADLAIILGAWGTPGPGDLDSSGSVDGSDLAILLGNWGPCAP